MVTVMMRPRFAVSMCGNTARAMLIGAAALTVMKLAHCSGVVSQKRIGSFRWSGSDRRLTNAGIIHQHIDPAKFNQRRTGDMGE